MKKKVIAILLSAVTVMSLIGCGSAASVAEAPQATEEAAPAATEEAAPAATEEAAPETDKKAKSKIRRKKI